MKAIYRGRLYHVSDDNGQGVFLSGDGPTPRFVSYADPDLVVDPTDDEVDEARANQDPAPRP